MRQKYNQIVEYYDNLPGSMVDGLGSLKLLTQSQLKKYHHFKKKLNGNYQTESSKGDKNIAASTKFFVNNFPSFTQFKNQDNLD